MKPLKPAEPVPPKWTSWCATMMQRGVKLEIGWSRRTVLDHDEVLIPGAVQRPLDANA